MCKFETKLIAWMDGELDSETALELDAHVPACETCAARAAGYREVGQAFAAYCATTVIPSTAPRSRPMAFRAAAVLTAAAALILWMLRPLPEPSPIEHPRIGKPAVVASQTAPASLPPAIKAVHHRTAPRRVESPTPWIQVEPTIEIVLPADAMLAPGAIPAGVAFAADLSIAGDGSPEALRVGPSLYLK